MSNPTPEQLDLTQPIDRVVKQIVDLAAAERAAKLWQQAILRLVPKEHHAPADAVRYVEERLNAWGGLLATAGFKQDDGARAAQHLTDEVRAYARLRGALALRLGVPRDATDAVLLERLIDLASLAHGVGGLRELNAGLKAQLEEARPKAELWNSLKQALGGVPDNDVIPQVAETRKALHAIGDALGFSRMERPYRVSDEAVQRLRVAIAKQRQLGGWVQVAHLLCGAECDLDNVDGVVASARSERDELNDLRACMLQVTNALRLPPGSPREKVVYVVNEVTGRAPPLFLGRLGAWARLEQVLGLKDPAAIAAQVESLVVDREGKERAHADELAKAQQQAAQWEIQAQDLRDELTDFRNQVARALGAEPSSLTTDEMLRQVGEGAAARRAHADLVEARYVAERLLAAVRAQLPQFVGRRHDDTSLWPLRELCDAINRGYITQAIWAHRAWDAIVSRFNAQSAKTALPFESADTEAAILSAIDVGAQLQRWMREQAKTEAKG